MDSLAVLAKESKCCLTPSVHFVVNVPTSIDGSFYTGQVLVGLKENAFQP